MSVLGSSRLHFMVMMHDAGLGVAAHQGRPEEDARLPGLIVAAHDMSARAGMMARTGLRPALGSSQLHVDDAMLEQWQLARLGALAVELDSWRGGLMACVPAAGATGS